MNIRYLQNHEIEADKWDNCIAHSFNGLVYAYSWYLDSVCHEWHALIEGDYERVFPLIVKRKYGVDLIFQPFFTQQLGLFSRKILNSEVVEKFIEHIPSKFKYIEINLNSLNKIESDKLEKIPQLNLELDLIKTYEKIGESYSKNLKRNLKKAENANLSINKNLKPDEVIRLFRENRGKQIDHLKDSDYHRFKRLVYSGVYKGMADVYGVYSQMNELCAGGIFMRSHNRASFLFSGLNDTGKELGAMPFLIDAYIKDHAGRHLTFDFEGSNDEQLARFYKGFGAQEVWYIKLILNRMNRLQQMGFKFHRKLK